MPNRILKDSICTSEEINNLKPNEEVFFYRLLVSCDDYGRFDGRTSIIKSRLYPLKENIKNKDIEKLLISLINQNLIFMYKHNDAAYIQVSKWEKHQQIRNHKSKYPSPNDENSNLISIDINGNQKISDVTVIQSNPIQSESNAVCEKTKKFIAPTIEEIKAYCIERKNNVNPERFLYHYETNGWVQGKDKPIKDWKACVRTWEQNNFNDKSKTSKKTSKHNLKNKHEYDFDELQKKWIGNQ